MLDTIRKLLDLIGRDQHGRWALIVALALAVSALEAAGVLLIFTWLGLLVSDGDRVALPLVGDVGLRTNAHLVGMGVAVAAFFLVRSAIIVGQSYAQFRAAEKTGARVSTRMVAGYLSMPYAYHLQRNSSEMVRNAVDSVQRVVAEGLVPAVAVVSKSAVVAAVLVVLVAASPTESLLAVLVLGPMLWLILRVVQPRVKRLGATAQAMAKQNLQTLQQSLQGARDIVLLGREEAFVRSYARDRRRLARARYLQRTAGQIPRVGIETGVVLSIVVFVIFLVGDDTGADAMIPVLGLFGYAAMRLMPEFSMISKNLSLLKFVTPALDDILEDLAAFERVERPPPTEKPLPFRRELALEGVSFRYPGGASNAICEVDLVVRAGESVGIVGPTGGGKSTLIDVILGLLPPTEGAVRVDGLDIHTRLRGWHANLGVVSQTVFLTDDTLRRNIALGVPDEEVDEQAVEEALRLAQLEEFVAALPGGLDTVVGERGVWISGGQRQRLAIARALYRQPQVLVLDEGTSALDNETEAAFLTSLGRLRGSYTLLTVAHRLATVQSCDRVLLLRGGRIVDSGPYPELAARQATLRLSPTE
ncbi:MAG TPA: ABC transporter ATP-binding protein [Egibacteraceae bacterium]|nr:ABC transporter ATP-binding protein [Egibacteraceae bacterium]